MQEKPIAFVKVQARKVQNLKGRKEPSSYMLTIPKDAVDRLKVKSRSKEEKVQVLLNEESMRLVYQF